MFCISSYIGEYNANAIAVTATMQAECQRKVAHFRFVFVCHDACQYLLSVWFGLVCWYTFFRSCAVVCKWYVHCNVQNYERYVVTQLTDINPLNCCDGIQKNFSPFIRLAMHVVLIWAANFSWKMEHPAKGISNKIDLNSFFSFMSQHENVIFAMWLWTFRCCLSLL